MSLTTAAAVDIWVFTSLSFSALLYENRKRGKLNTVPLIYSKTIHGYVAIPRRSARVAEWLALPTLDHAVSGSNTAGDDILSEPKLRFIAQSLSCSPFHCPDMTEIPLNGT